MSEDKTKEILEAYQQMLNHTREALRLTGMPEPLVISYTINLPDFDKLIPEDIVKFYKDVRKLVVLHLFEVGLGQGEIAKQLGGGQYYTVWEILKEANKEVGDPPEKK